MTGESGSLITYQKRLKLVSRCYDTQTTLQYIDLPCLVVVVMSLANDMEVLAQIAGSDVVR